MSSFNGFREGCPGELKRGQKPYIDTVVRFQADGKTLDPRQAGQTRPDAVRVIPVDDYEGSMYRDKVFTFDEQTAATQVARGDAQVPEGNVFTLDPSQVQGLNAACESCDPANGRCEVLYSVLQLALNQPR